MILRTHEHLSFMCTGTSNTSKFAFVRKRWSSNVSVDTLLSGMRQSAADATLPHTHVHACSMKHGSRSFSRAFSVMSMLCGSLSASLRRFPAPPVSAVLREAKLQTLAGAVGAPWHARTLFHVIFDAHAACHAARAHVKRAQGRSVPRACAGTLCSEHRCPQG